ncbi:MAG: TIGR03089 family protein [Candidatus Nanopelagicales bacterium]
MSQPPGSPTLAQARALLLNDKPTSPLITDCTQARVELSHATFDNWVSKTVNFLQMEADLEPGATVSLALPLHWMSAVWLVAAWESGADVVLGAETADLRVGTDAGSEVVVVPDPLGMRPPPAGVDAEWFFPADVRAMPDQRVLPPPPPGGMAGLAAPRLAQAAAEYADVVGLTAGGRLLTALPLLDLAGVLAAIGAPLAARAGVIYGTAAGQEAPTAVAG